MNFNQDRANIFFIQKYYLQFNQMTYVFNENSSLKFFI